MAVRLGSRSNIGYVRGFSMWPNLIPGDILKTQIMKADQLRPGMIAVLPIHGECNSIVHRIRTVRNFQGSIVVSTYGDRAGKDFALSVLHSSDRIKAVCGVLRGGRYRKITRWRIPAFLSTEFSVRLACRIVRRVFW